MFVIVLNQNNIVQDGSNNTLVYNFPNSIVFKDKYIAVSSIQMYYSWFNITSALANNLFTYTWIVGGVSTTYNINIPNGIYEIEQLNKLIQFVCIQNGTYLIDGNNNYVYYFEIEVNPVRYAVQLNTFQVPTSLPAGYSQPANFAGYPTNTFNPVVSFPSYFNQIVGYSAGFSSNPNTANGYVPPSPTQSTNYASKDGYGTLSYLSNTYPNVQPNSSLYVSISNINNPYSIPSSIIYSITSSVAVGEQITDRPPNFMWNKLIDGTYNELRVQFLGTNYQPITINDPQMTIMLTIRDKDESFMGSK